MSKLARKVQRFLNVNDSTPSVRAYPSLRSLELTEVSAPERSADDIIMEMNALNAAGMAVESIHTMTEARSLVRDVYQARQGVGPRTTHSMVINAAMAKIIGESIEVETSYTEGWEAVVTETISVAWVEWARGLTGRTIQLLTELREKQSKLERVAGQHGAINLMAMYYWLTAVEHLAKDDQINARRFWQRSLEIGSHFGTDSHLLVSWTYAASFFPTD